MDLNFSAYTKSFKKIFNLQEFGLCLSANFRRVYGRKVGNIFNSAIKNSFAYASEVSLSKKMRRQSIKLRGGRGLCPARRMFYMSRRRVKY